MKILFLCLLLISPAVAFAQPSIGFDADIHDFGVVSGDEPLRHTFEISNNGTEDLIIHKIEAP